jgi:hypothetical protein
VTGMHFVQEDSPEEVGAAIRTWLFRASPLPFETAARPYLSTESHRTLQGGTDFAPDPGNKLPGYHHLVPPGQRSRENEAPR